MKYFEYLVISGGGFTGISFLGALHYFIKYKWLNINNIHTLVGSSIGAVICSLLVCGFTPKDMMKKILHINLEDLMCLDISNFINNFGIDSGANIISQLEKYFIEKGFDPNITFLQLFNLTQKHLILTSTCVNTHKIEYFDYKNTPHLKVIDGIRASISVPFYFTAPQYKAMYYTDGGVLENFPIF